MRLVQAAILMAWCWISTPATVVAHAPAPHPWRNARIEARYQNAAGLVQRALGLYKRQIIGPERERANQEAQTLIRRAAEEFSAVARELKTLPQRPPGARALEMRACVQAGSCWVVVGQQDKAQLYFEIAAGAAPMPMDRIEAVRGLAGCYAAKADWPNLRQQVQRLRGMLAELRPEVRKRHDKEVQELEQVLQSTEDWLTR